MFCRHYCLLLSSLLVLNGCASIGPKQIDVDREAYNDIVRETDYEQILKNIVRLSYAEPTSYLKITNVTASYQFRRSMSGNLGIEQTNSNNTSALPNSTTGVLGVSPSVEYSDAPTISYVPIDDAAFVTALQQPVNFEDISLLVNGGMSDTSLIMRLVFDWVGGLDNASSAANSKVIDRPEYTKYYEFMNILLKMIAEKKVYIDPVNLNGKHGVIIDFVHNSETSPEAYQLKKLLDVPLSSKDIILDNQNIINLKMDTKNNELLEEDSSAVAKNLVFVQTRSLNGIMAFLSHSVQIPDADLKSGIAPPRTINGQVFDWKPLMQGLMSIASSDKEPTNAFVKTWVNGHWFYIDKSDIDSKVTFTLIVRLMILKAGISHNGNQSAPVITVPVGVGR